MTSSCRLDIEDTYEDAIELFTKEVNNIIRGVEHYSSKKLEILVNKDDEFQARLKHKDCDTIYVCKIITIEINIGD